MNTKQELEYVKGFIKYVEAAYGNRICAHKNQKEYHPSCINCQAQWALGWLRDHQSLVQWEIDELEEVEKKNKED